MFARSTTQTAGRQQCAGSRPAHRRLFQYAGLEVRSPRNENSEGLLALRELIPQNQGGLLHSSDVVWLLGGKDGRNTIYDALVQECELTRCDLYQRHDAQLPQLDTETIQSIVVGSIHGLERAASHWQQCGGSKECAHSRAIRACSAASAAIGI